MNDSYTRAPHRRTGAEERSTNAALLIDFDNVTMGIRSNLGLELRKLLNSDMIRGKVAVQRAYADWRRYPQYIVPLSEASIDLIFAPAYGSSKKNATDIRLAIDALELVFTRPEIGTYILLSGDSDFSSLVLKLKEYGKYVIGVGMQESSSDLLVQNCDEYYSYNSISGLTSAAESPTEKHDPWVLAARAIRKMEERGDVMRSDRFKQVMLELDGSFDEKEIGYSKFNRFATEAASRGIVVLEKAPNGQYEVSAGPRAADVSQGGSGGAQVQAGGAGEPSEPRKPRSRGGRSRSRSEGRERQARREAPPATEESPDVDEDRLRAAYRLLREVVAELAGGDEAVRDSEVKRRMLEKDGQFDEGALGFRKFSRFLRQAHDEEVVDLERGPEGNYLVSPAGHGGEGEAPAARRERPSADRGEGRDRSGRRDRHERAGEETAGAEPQPREREESRRREGRSERRGSRRDRGRDRDGGRRAGEAEPKAAPEPEAAAHDVAATPPERDAPQHEEPAGSGAPVAEPETKPQADAGHEARRTASVGRFRRGSRGRGPGPERKAVVPGPVDDASAGGTTAEGSPTKEAERPAGQKTDGSPAETATPAGGGKDAPVGRRSVSGRDRGRAHRQQEPGRQAPASDAALATPDAGGEAGGGTPTAFRSEIDAMARNYPGVGRRTAEALFQEFGDRVYDVIDSDPGRIRQVLPKHRAKAVLEGRAAQTQSDEEPGTQD